MVAKNRISVKMRCALEVSVGAVMLMDTETVMLTEND